VTPQCGVAICRLALPSPSLTPLPFPRSLSPPSLQLLGCIYEASPGIGSALFEGRTRCTNKRYTQVEGTKDRGGRGPREERLTRRDQRRDSCLWRVSLRRQASEQLVCLPIRSYRFACTGLSLNEDAEPTDVNLFGIPGRYAFDNLSPSMPIRRHSPGKADYRAW